MKIFKYLYPNFFFLLLGLFFLGGTATLINATQGKLKKQRILVVNSYHPGYTWSDDIMLGIRDVFATQKNVELIIEHLDTKKHIEKPYLRQIEDLFRHKYRSANIDIIITSDDNALDFILGIRKELFPDIPLIYCGIDHIKTERTEGQKHIYGIEEADSTSSTIDLILSIHPDLESITFIADDTSTGKLMIEKTKKIESSYQKNIIFNYLTDLTTEDLQSTLRNISNNTVVFYLSFIRDKNGKTMSIENSMKLVANSANIPVYCSWGFKPDTGVLGGNILSGYKQGEISAIVARRLLDCNLVDSIPAIQQAPLVYKFDYQALSRFNIDDSNIPQNSIIYNKPFSIYSDYKKLIWSILCIILCLILFIMLLSLNIGRRKKAETELQKAHVGLEHKVKKRTAELTESNKLLTKEIQERKSKEKALKESEAQKKAILDGITTNLAFVNKNLEIKWVNKASANSAIKSPEEMIGFKCYEFWGDHQKPCNNCPAVKAFKTNKTESSIMYNPDGRVWEERGEPVFDENEKMIGVIEIAHDITEKHQMEKQLQQSQKIEAIGTLAGGIAHDFNNMLGIIFGNVSYLLNQFKANEELVDVLSDIQEGTKKAQSLTQQLLTFSMGGAPVKKVTDVKSLIKESAEFVVRGAKTRCSFDLPDDLWVVEVDSGQLNQVFTNLIINANQAMPNGGVIIIRSENIDIQAENIIPLPMGKYIKITIEDQGVGISEKHLPNIFDPYFSTKQAGSGLGLATSYSIITRHGGHIWAESKIDEGTTFYIYLPASEKEIIQVEDKANIKHSGNGKILIMDDQESILKMVGRMLNFMGYDTVFTTDGAQAIDIYNEAYQSQKPFDVVILDLTVPGGMGGVQVISELLKIDPKVKAVVSSGYSNDPIMSNYEEYGFCGVIPKPYSKNQLAELLNKIISGKS